MKDQSEMRKGLRISLTEPELNKYRKFCKKKRLTSSGKSKTTTSSKGAVEAIIKYLYKRINDKNDKKILKKYLDKFTTKQKSPVQNPPELVSSDQTTQINENV